MDSEAGTPALVDYWQCHRCQLTKPLSDYRITHTTTCTSCDPPHQAIWISGTCADCEESTPMADGNQRYTSPAWRALARYIKDRDQHLCQIRGKGCTVIATSVDHIDPIISGGSMWDERNLRAACRRCNSRLGALVRVERSARYRRTTATYQTRF